MAGFYGNISASNRTAFTFDKIYNNRFSMDNAINEDGIFLGRYVLVEYDNPPITGYYDSVSDEFYGDRHFNDATIIPKREGVIYQNLGQSYSTNSFYCCVESAEASGLTYVAADVDTSPFAMNYNLDIRNYGRGYDSTVWIKIYDIDRNVYRYVMVAELNTVVPNFHLVIDPPSSIPYSPYFDGATTNLDYYMHMQAPYTFKIGLATDTSKSDDTISYITSNYNSANGIWTHQLNTGNADIFYNKAGFSSETRSYIDTNLVGGMPNTISYDLISSGQKFYGIENPAKESSGQTARDTIVWKIHLPSLGNAICEIWDRMFTTDRLRNLLTETHSNINLCTIDTESVYGYTNAMRCYVGRVYGIPQSQNRIDHADGSFTVIASDTLGALGTGGTHTFNRAILFRDDAQDTRRYFYPNYTSTWSQDNNGEYYLAADGSYRLANKQIQNGPFYSRNYGLNGGNLHWRYTYEYTSSSLAPTSGLIAVQMDLDPTEDKALYAAQHPNINLPTNVFNDAPHTLYGALAMIHRILGTGLSMADSRDERTVIGLMNRMKDMIANIDTQINPGKVLISDANGMITTSSISLPGSNSDIDKVLSGNGTWLSLSSGKLVDYQSNNNASGEIVANDTLNTAFNKLNNKFASYQLAGNYITAAYLSENNYVTTSYLSTNNYITASYLSTNNYVTTSYLSTNNYLTQNTDDPYLTQSQIEALISQASNS